MGYTVPSRGAANWDISLQTLFDQIFDDVTSAGTGTAKMRIGTRAERVAYSASYSGLQWNETDTGEVWLYDGSAWVFIGVQGSMVVAGWFFGL